ncbi:MAG TPA: GNAT family N-acetyltransferase [Acidimicrobiia bacterium]|jgi:phosphinothricin acetyltransferase|nr:GNAT family N-acetyltransferase [Acidimicrobiia bacterium]
MDQSSSADTEAVTLRAMTPDDWPRAAEILTTGLEEGQATFETRVPDWEHWDRSHLPGLRLVAVDADGLVVGWVAASPVSRRVVYEGVVEHSIYVDAGARGRGVGRMLLERFITDSENAGVWTVEAVIFPENAASLALHLGCGFRVVGTRKRIARHHGVWRDVVLVERRSPRFADLPQVDLDRST